MLLPLLFCCHPSAKREDLLLAFAFVLAAVLASGYAKALSLGPLKTTTDPQQDRPCRGEVTHSIVFVLPLYFFLRFQPKNLMSSPQAT
jgi:hypothetical protein